MAVTIPGPRASIAPRTAAVVVLLSLAFASCSTNGAGAPEADTARAAEPRVRFLGPTTKVGIITGPSRRTLRIPGRTAVVHGYLVAHPAIGEPLTFKRGGRDVPVLSFVLSLHVADSIVTRSLSGGGIYESMSGSGKLRIYYNPDGVDADLLVQRRLADDAIEIEEDDVRFEMQTQSRRYVITLREKSVASRPFEFRGRTISTPVGREAIDTVRAEWYARFAALAFASNQALSRDGFFSSASPSAKLDELLAPMRL
jgi:hypothetical protein